MNSAHQLWSKWTFVVRPGSLFVPDFETVKMNTARFGRKAFGSAAQMRITQYPKAWVVEIMAEGDRHPHDSSDLQYLGRAFTEFFRSGFGHRTQVLVKTRLLAGARLDGRPSDQLIVLPSILEGVH